ncbi:MAG: hypothetical protein ACXWJD_13510 [Burkholderiaceae bacterium]
MRNPFAQYLPGSTSLRIGLAPNGIAIMKTSGWLRPQTTLLAECALSPAQSASPEAVATELRRLLADVKCVNLPVSIVVADQWARLFMVIPPQNSGSLQDCKAAAAMRFQQLYGEALDRCELRADWQTQHAFLACAIPTPLLAAVQKIAQDHKLTLLSVVPQFIATWNQWRNNLKADAWFGLVHDSMLTLAAIDQQRICAVRTTTLPEGAWDAQWLTTHLTREAMLLNVPIPKQVQLCGSVPSQSVLNSPTSPSFTQLDIAARKVGYASESATSRLACAGIAS